MKVYDAPDLLEPIDMKAFKKFLETFVLYSCLKSITSAHPNPIVGFLNSFLEDYFWTN